MSGQSQVQEPNESCKGRDQDFSEAWEQSDLILLVEEKQLHVHRAILALSSPVFSRMFNGDFKEKDAKQIPLPGKNYKEIKEMLFVIYPSSWKPVDESNCNFLLALAQEYQMTKLTQKCEDYLIDSLAKRQGSDIMKTLALAQDYELERAIDESIVRTKSLTINQVKQHPLYDQIEPLSQRKMIELQMQKEIERLKRLANEALQQLNEVASILAWHIRVANLGKEDAGPRKRNTVDTTYNPLLVIKNDENRGSRVKRRVGICEPLKEVDRPLEIIQSSLFEISQAKIQY